MSTPPSNFAAPGTDTSHGNPPQGSPWPPSAGAPQSDASAPQYGTGAMQGPGGPGAYAPTPDQGMPGQDTPQGNPWQHGSEQAGQSAWGVPGEGASQGNSWPQGGEQGAGRASWGAPGEGAPQGNSWPHGGEQAGQGAWGAQGQVAPVQGGYPQGGNAGYGQPQWAGQGANGPAGQQGWGQPGQPGPSLDEVPVRRAKKAAGSGWRKAVHHISGGAINPGMSAEELRLQELVARIRQPVRGDYRIAVLSLKGGVGKTTTTMGLGSIFASVRGDRVIAVDANPDFGTLSQRVPLQTRSTVRDLLLDPNIQRYSDVRRHTSQGGSRLEVLASERDPAASEAFSEEEYRAVARILQRFYNIILTDCGTGLMHSAMAGVLDLAHSLVLISSSAIDGARSAAATLDWLSLHGHDHLVRNAVVVINLPRPGAPNVGINQLRDYFLSRCRAVHIIPYDAHLGEGAEIDLQRLHKNTKRSLVELAATVADDFASDHRRYRG
ncbi:MinD/ParA family ATP-binding protein [Nocardia huaxiensis]|uniref:MinD/ParA family ATP-binding protein n=1 Tax=Nocardia huaxiensis TaxID=2755382 RepID=UPI001E53ECC6|nr:MinD/ParA family protein [Nocardia huaxiensis]UFT00266.1 AAA family ATPase [Nocardia huaxiensis]